jgi:hypothetical protein
VSADQLGVAELELGADLKPLDKDLATAKRRVELFVATAQAQLDKLQLNLDAKGAAIDALAARAAKIPQPATQTTVVNENAPQRSASAGPSELWGVRGPNHPGSITNPLVVVVEAAKRTQLGSFAAAVGEDDSSDAQRGDSSSGIATAAQLAALTAAVQDLAQNAVPSNRLATVGANGMGESPERAAIALDDQDGQVLRSIAATLSRLEQRAESSSGPVVLGVPSSRGGSSFVWAGASSGSHAGGTGTPVFAVPLAGGGGGGGRPPVVVRPPAGGDGGNGNVARALLYGGGGMFGLAGMGSLLSLGGLGPEHVLMTLLGLAGSAASAGLGGGLLAAGAAGSIGVGAGSDLGVMKSTISDAQTLGQAVAQISAAQQALAPYQAQFAREVKIVADPGVSKAYANLVAAVKEYGVNSTQAAAAQTKLNAQVTGLKNPQLTAAYSKFNTQLSGVSAATANLNNQMIALGNTAGVKAEAGLAKAGSALDDFWDAQTSGARVQAVHILMQAIQAGYTFVPLIAQAAERNLAQINTDLKPLFAWLEGPHGVGIWHDLENVFARNLPYAMGAFDNGVELVLRVVDIAAQHTGGFTRELDKLLTRANSMSNSQLSAWVMKYIDDFRLWEHFVKLLGEDIYGLFRNDAGTGNAIITDLNGMLTRLHEWENSTRGRQDLETIFTVHRQEVVALLNLLPGLIRGFSSIYMTLAPPLTRAVTGIAEAFAAVVNAIDGLGPNSQALLGLTLIAGKLGVLMPGLRALATAVGAEKTLAKIPGIGGAFTSTSGSGIMGVRGPAAPGSAANPIAVTGLEVGGGIPVAGATAAEGAAAAEVSTFADAAGLAIKAIPIAGAAIVAMSIAHDALQKLFPNLGSSAPTVKINDVNRWIFDPTRRDAFGATQLGQPGGQTHPLAQLGPAPFSHAQLTQINADFLRMNGMLATLEQHKTGVSQTAAALAGLSQQAHRLGDVPYTFADKLGSELLHGRSVASNGVRQLLSEFDRLSPGVQTRTAAAMTQMAETLYRMGFLSQTQLKQLLVRMEGALDTGFGQMLQTVKARTGSMRDAVSSNTRQLEQVGSANFENLVANIASYLGSGAEATAKGVASITEQVNAVLKAYGSQPPSPVTVASLTPAQLAAVVTGQVSPGAAASPHATGGKVTSPLIMVGEEAPQHPEFVLATNPAYRERNLDLWAQAGAALGIPGFAQGGIVGPAVHGAGAIATLVRSGLARDVSAVNAWLMKKTAAASGGSAGAGFSVNVPGSLRNWLSTAMGIVGVSGPLWLSMLERQAMRESSGDPNSVNNWDINAQRGDPSEGLLQTTLSTFASYALPGHGNILNPVDNAIAAIRYMIATYGGGNPDRAAAVMWARGGGAYRTGGRIGGTGAPVPGYYRPRFFPAKLSSKQIQGNLGGISNQFQGYQTTFGNTSQLAGVLQGVQPGPGTNLGSLGLYGAGLGASGLKGYASALLGGTAASYQALISIDTHEITGYRTESLKLRELYKDALHNHNKKLATAILGELQTVDNAMAQAISDRQQALISKIQAKAQTFQTSSDAIGSGEGLLSTIENFAPGTNLGALGLTPSILGKLLAGTGITGKGAQALVGTGLSYFQNLASSQGGSLTAAQLASAKTGIGALNGAISNQIQPLAKELAMYQSALPTLKGTNKTNAITAMGTLANSITSLEGTIQQNTDGLTQLTTATNSNTAATTSQTNSFTGTTAFSYQGQSFLASDNPLNVGVGG